MNTASIILNNISVQQYGKTVLNNIFFHLATNQHPVIIGKPGSGKTILGKTIASQVFHHGKVETSFVEIPALPSAIAFQVNTILIYVNHYENEHPPCIQYKMELSNGKQVYKNMQEIIAA